MHKPYPTYRDSGIEWIGQIPTHWDVCKLKHEFTMGKGLPITKEDLKDDGVKVVNYGQIHSKLNIGVGVKPGLTKFVSEDFLSSHTQCIVPKDGFIFADTSEDLAGSGNCIYQDLDEIVFAGYHTIVLFPKADRNNKYLAYLFKDDNWRSQIRSRVSGVKVVSITKSILDDCTIILPPISEQEAIAEYLEDKCTKIDELVAKLEAQAQDLNKLKVAEISRVVTRGLNPDTPLRNSGIEWIGQIPTHWDVCKLKQMCDRITDGSHFSPSTTKAGKHYVTVSDVKDGYIDIKNSHYISEQDFEVLKANGCQPKSGEVLLSKDGTVGRTAVVQNNDFVALSSLGILSPKQYLHSKFLKYTLDSKILQDQMTLSMAGSALRRITIEKIKDLVSILPPLSEQEAIANYLDDFCGKIDSIVSEINAQIKDLKERYKPSIISEAVTGKICVTDYKKA